MAVYFEAEDSIFEKKHVENHVSNFHEIHSWLMIPRIFSKFPQVETKESIEKHDPPRKQKLTTGGGGLFFKTAHPTPKKWVVETVVRKTPGTPERIEYGFIVPFCMTK